MTPRLWWPAWTRSTHATLLAAWVAFVVYGSLVPLRFTAVPWQHAVEHFANVVSGPVAIQSNTDLSTNVLLFVPLGYLLVATLRVDRTGRLGDATAFVFTVIVSAALTGTIEFLQTYFSRTVALSDMLAETAGGVLGGTGWLWSGRRITSWLRDFAQEASRTSLLTRVLVMYMAAYLGSQMLPLDVSLDPARLARKYALGLIRLRPFSFAHDTWTAAAWDYAGDVALAVPLGLLLAMVASRKGPHVVLRGMAVVTLVEALQVFVLSRYADSTDIITGAVGVSLGVALEREWSHARVRAGVAPSAAARGPMARVAAVVWLAVLATYHWSPYDFSTSPAQVNEGLQRLLQVPFYSYYQGTEFNAFTEMARKAMLAAPLGVLLAMARSPSGTSSGARATTALLCLGALALLVIECGQVFLRTRYPDVTDVVLGTVGVAAGVWIHSVILGRRPPGP